MKNESDCFDKLDYNLLQPTFCAYCVVMSRLSYRMGMGMGGIWELLDGKKWEWDLSFRWEWEWDGNGNEVTEMGGNWYEKSIPAHLYCTGGLSLNCLAWSWVGGRLAPFYIHQMNRVNSRNGCAMIHMIHAP